MTLDDLRPLLRRKPPEGEPVPGTIMLAADDDLGALLAYFTADRARRTVRVVVGGRSLGYLERTALYPFFETRTKGLGDSMGARLPGFPPASAYRLLTLRCPKLGCTAGPVVATRYDPSAPPRCELHPELTLQLT
jgi:hypothetical protein